MTHLVLLLLLAAAVQSGACPAMCTCRTSPYASVRCENYSENITRQLDQRTHSLTLIGLGHEELQAVVDELQELPFLTQLSIARANLTLDGLFNLTGLQSLDLSDNSLTAVGSEPFRTLRSLELLNLSANLLSLIEADSFSGLAALKCLDLSGNDLTTLEDSVFTPLLSLQYLNLSNNRLEVLNEKCFIPLLKLQQLDASWNSLVRVDLGSLQLPSLARLLLAGNPQLGVSREPVLLVGTGQRLQTVDASRIGLKQVPAALTHSIRTLRLAGNAIKTVRCGDLDSYPLLQLLDFNSNSLESMEDDALGRLDSLSILYLTNNTMREIPKSLSEKLKVLHLEHNRIEKISRKDLQGLTALEVLLLNDNKISVIEAGAFNQLSALVTLDVSRNPIKILEAGCLSGSMALQVLRLSGVAVVSPAREVSFPVSSTEHLITLDLSGSPGLARQLLVDTAALAASRELQELDLSYTELDYIRSDLLHFLPQLRIFRIEGNRINCTQLQWLAAWMRRQDEPEYKKVACASPPELWGTLLIDLQDVEISYNYLQTTPQPSKRNEIRSGEKASPRIYANNETETRRNETFWKLIETKEESSVHLDPALAAANETRESPSNHKLDETEISRDLFAASEEKTVSRTPPLEKHNNKSNELFPEEPSVTLDVDPNSNSSHRWNASMSMFSAGDRKRGLLHPGMLVLAAGVLGTAAVLAMLAARWRRRTAMRQQEDLEVSSLPGVTELW